MMMLLKALSDLRWLNSEENTTYLQRLNVIKMKTKTAIMAGFLMVCFFSFTSMLTKNSTEIFEGIYDGQEDYGYNFIGIDDDDEEYTMTFHEVDESLLKSFDLQSEQLVGTKFMVTYTISTETLKDEDGFEDEIETYTIIALKKL
jgi:hypothetical protein